MSTKFGVIAEGAIDEALLPALVERVARDLAGLSWPTVPADLGRVLMMRKRGHGGVLEKVRELACYLEGNPFPDCAFFVIVLDRKTQPVVREIRRLLRSCPRTVLGIAIEEIEAWWLADRTACLAWLGMDDSHRAGRRYWAAKYKPERDKQPKLTLHELTELSPKLTECYGRSGNVALARQFAEECWLQNADVKGIAQACSQGFGRFSADLTQALVRARGAAGYLF